MSSHNKQAQNYHQVTNTSKSFGFMPGKTAGLVHARAPKEGFKFIEAKVSSSLQSLNPMHQ